LKSATLLTAITLTLFASGCSMLSDDDTEVRVVEQKEIEVSRVFISKGREQCEDSTGRSLDDTKVALEEAGIRVFSSSCALITGTMSPALCGSQTLHINIHGIDSDRFGDAEAIGFRPLKSLEEADLGFDPEGCD
jgi:hypothetical protein